VFGDFLKWGSNNFNFMLLAGRVRISRLKTRIFIPLSNDDTLRRDNEHAILKFFDEIIGPKDTFLRNRDAYPNFKIGYFPARWFGADTFSMQTERLAFSTLMITPITPPMLLIYARVEISDSVYNCLQASIDVLASTTRLSGDLFAAHLDASASSRMN
jgi:hypothetical protein